MSIIRNHKPVTVNTRSLFKVEQEMNIEKTRKRKKKNMEWMSVKCFSQVWSLHNHYTSYKPSYGDPLDYLGIIWFNPL